MPIYRLNKKLSFPHPSNAEKEGILAIGGDLSVDRLILAYANGIFPWPQKDSPILWWSPDPRMVLFPDKFKVSKQPEATCTQWKVFLYHRQGFR